MNNENKILKLFDVIDPNEEESISAIYEENKIFFDMAVKLLKLSYSILPLGGKSLKNDIHPHVQRALLALYVQAFRLFRSVIILCKSGLDREALIQLRSMLETISYLLYIEEKDHFERLAHYLHSRALSLKVAIEDFILAFPEADSMLNKEWFIEKYEEALRYFKTKYGKDIILKDIKEKYALRADVAAQSIENSPFCKQYQVFHRYASAIGHGENIFEFIHPTSSASKFMLPVNPTGQWTKFCLAEAMSFIFPTMESINELLKIGKDEEIGKIKEELKDFLYKNYTKPALGKFEQRRTQHKEEQNR